MGRPSNLVLVAGGVIYALFAVSCFRLAVIHGYERGISVGEGMFTLLGAAALFVALTRPRWRAAIVIVSPVRGLRPSRAPRCATWSW